MGLKRPLTSSLGPANPLGGVPVPPGGSRGLEGRRENDMRYNGPMRRAVVDTYEMYRGTIIYHHPLWRAVVE